MKKETKWYLAIVGTIVLFRLVKNTQIIIMTDILKER